MSRHTPGPWSYRQMKTRYAIEAANGVRVAEVRHIGRPDGSTSEDEARLIAAAPELLAACKEALSRFEADGYEDTHHGGKTLVALRAAIAKAEGGAS